MTLAEVDATLARFNGAIDVMTANLLELEANPTSKLLDPATLTGTTQQQVANARATLESLWEHFTEIKNLVEKASTLRGTSGHVPQARLLELEALLRGPSITLPPIDVPLANRGLYTPSQTPVATTPDELLTSMASAFQTAKAVVLAIDDAWRTFVSRLSAARDELSSLATLAAKLGESGDALDRPSARLDALGAQVANDPLAVNPSDFAQVDAALAALRARLDQLDHDRASLSRDLAEGADKIREIAEAIEQGAAALAETQVKILNPQGLLAALQPSCLTDPERGLTTWLQRLRDMADSGDWRSACRGIDQWERLARETSAAARTVLEANAAPLKARNELRGRLDALAAKAERLGLTEHPDLAAVREHAHAVLYTAPTDLGVAGELVAQYGASLNRSASTKT